MNNWICGVPAANLFMGLAVHVLTGASGDRSGNKDYQGVNK